MRHRYARRASSKHARGSRAGIPRRCFRGYRIGTRPGFDGPSVMLPASPARFSDHRTPATPPYSLPKCRPEWKALLRYQRESWRVRRLQIPAKPAPARTSSRTAPAEPVFFVSIRSQRAFASSLLVIPDYRLGQQQQPRTNPQFGLLGCLHIDFKPHLVLHQAETDHSPLLDEPVRLPNGQDRPVLQLFQYPAQPRRITPADKKHLAALKTLRRL